MHPQSTDGSVLGLHSCRALSPEACREAWATAAGCESQNQAQPAIGERRGWAPRGREKVVRGWRLSPLRTSERV
jgi:hypothetical protein